MTPVAADFQQEAESQRRSWDSRGVRGGGFAMSNRDPQHDEHRSESGGDERSAGSLRPMTHTGSVSPGGVQRMLRTLAAVVLLIHGLVHLMGVALLWRWGQPGELRYDHVHPAPGTTAGTSPAACGCLP